MSIENRIKYASKQAVWYRNYRRARERALTRLSQAHADEYKTYLQEEKARDKENGTAWDTLSSGLDSGLGDQPYAYDKNGKDTALDGAQGNDGGEA